MNTRLCHTKFTLLRLQSTRPLAVHTMVLGPLLWWPAEARCYRRTRCSQWINRAFYRDRFEWFFPKVFIRMVSSEGFSSNDCIRMFPGVTDRERCIRLTSYQLSAVLTVDWPQTNFGGVCVFKQGSNALTFKSPKTWTPH